MQVKCTNPGTKAVRPAAFPGTEVRFTKNGFATVTDEVGKFLVRHYPAIVDSSTGKAKRSRRTAVNPTEPEPEVTPVVEESGKVDEPVVVTEGTGTPKEGE